MEVQLKTLASYGPTVRADYLQVFRPGKAVNF